jgi:hypothetical protein
MATFEEIRAQRDVVSASVDAWGLAAEQASADATAQQAADASAALAAQKRAEAQVEAQKFADLFGEPSG